MPALPKILTSLLALAALASSNPAPAPQPAHYVGARWYHPPGVGVESLFKRQGSTAQPGSPEFMAAYPPVNGVPNANASAIPARWLAAYQASKSAGHIPDIPVTTQLNGGNPMYPPGIVGTDPSICTATLKCRAPGDIWDAPDGMIGISFDDGPVAIAPTLYQFLRTNNIPATHFMIGRVILGDLDSFAIAFSQNHDSIAVHTWSHPMMTTQTDLQQVAEIGWTMQLIHDLTGGRIPQFWRPPLGDCDNRCRAIAKNVFNLTTVIWNEDTEDWRLSTGGTTGAWVSGNLTQWLTGPKTPGLIILEHELTADTVGFFMNTTYPLAVQNGWKMANIPDLFALPWYQNAQNDLDANVPPELVALDPSVAAGMTGGGTGTIVTNGSTATGFGDGPAPSEGGTGPAASGSSGSPGSSNSSGSGSPSGSGNGAVAATLAGSSSAMLAALGAFVFGALVVA